MNSQIEGTFDPTSDIYEIGLMAAASRRSNGYQT
jgi:hypothetical protein